MQVTVTYNPSVTSQPSNLESTLNVTLDYEQSDGTTVIPPAQESITTEDLKALAVTEGDGLYADEYEVGKYTYKGANPNNYITFNNETWRIISISSDGTLKIMRNESIENRAFDTNGGTYGNNNWDRPAEIKTYLNETYLPTITTNQDKIVPHAWSIGEVIFGNSDLSGQIAAENGTKSQSTSVGMITISEYLRANTNIEQCENISINNTNKETCLTTNWMYNIVPSGGYLWTLSPDAGDSSYGFYVRGYGTRAGSVGTSYAGSSRGVSPVLYLSSDITLTEDGSSSNPFVIS